MYRLDTDHGSFAVKELNLLDRRWTYRAEDVFGFERAAFAAGIPMPEPISAGRHALVHRWVEGEKMPEAPVPAAYAFEIGEILARLHARSSGSAVLRCLAGAEASTGPDLALSHESVRNGLRGLPKVFGRLPGLETLLV
jgi:fructosamine-3-kinase